MVKGTELPSLKRKREGAEPLRKKLKTPGKSKEVHAHQESGQAEVGCTSPALQPKPRPKPTPKPTSEPTSDPQVAHTNGVHDDPAPATPSSSRKSKKSSKGKKSIEKESAGTASATGVEPHRNIAPEPTSIPIVNGDTAEVKAENELAVERRNEAKVGREQRRVMEKKARKKERKSGRPDVVKESIDELQITAPRKEKKQKTKPCDLWSISAPQGGWFLPQDPVFSLDEKFLILAKLKTLQIYSTETSLLANELRVGVSAVILAYTLSATKSDHVYIADSAGIVSLWNWTEGLKIARWDIGASVRHLAVVTQPGSSHDLVFCHEAGNSNIINVHALRTRDQGSKTELKRIFKTGSPITAIQILLQGKIVIVSCHNSISVGKRTKVQKTALQDFEYTWREFKTSTRITTFNSYLQNPDKNTGKKPEQDPRDRLDVAVGDEKGVIHLFEDIFASFASIEKSQKDSKNQNVGFESLRPKRLHWHRDAVGSVKWSLDGNYLISGGDETVLTIWQLVTGKQQHLPHLTAAIENIVVSPSGASYAVSLANNSVIVLSTSELEAKTNIIGVQSRRIDLKQLPSESNPSGYSSSMFNSVPMVVDPKNSNRLMFATPSSQPRSQHPKFLPEPYVEIFDLARQRSVSRQALTRNNATDPNMGPEGRRIWEPSVKFLQISHDGEWLASVDEWIPPQADLGHLEEGIPALNDEERTYRREVYLKFWRWNEKNSQWILESRIDAPHFFHDVSANARVFDLVPDPSSSGFATVGEDRFVRIWRPKTRTRDGIIVYGADKSQGLVTWSLTRSIKIASKLDIQGHSSGPQETSILRTCRLAFSVDGSVLAAGVIWASEADPGVIHIIDPNAGTVRRSITELDVAALSGLGVIGRYLVVVGSSVAVWDLVNDQLVYCLPLDAPGAELLDRASLTRLAINESDSTFAVLMPCFEKNESSKSRDTRRFKKASSKIFIIDPEHPEAHWSHKIPELVLALASIKSGRGYVALDASSSVRVISPKTSALQLPTPPPEPAQLLLTDGMDVNGEDDTDAKERKSDLDLETLAVGEELLQNSENDKPVVRPEQLREIFGSGPSHALPPVRDLFNAVVGLYARKPRTSKVEGTA